MMWLRVVIVWLLVVVGLMLVVMKFCVIWFSCDCVVLDSRFMVLFMCFEWKCWWLVSIVVSIVMLIELLRLWVMLNRLEVEGVFCGVMLFIVKFDSVSMMKGWLRVCIICDYSSLL